MYKSKLKFSKGTRSYQTLPVLFAFFESRKGEAYGDKHHAVS